MKPLFSIFIIALASMLSACGGTSNQTGATPASSNEYDANTYG